MSKSTQEEEDLIPFEITSSNQKKNNFPKIIDERWQKTVKAGLGGNWKKMMYDVCTFELC